MRSLGIDYEAAAWSVALWDEAQAADLHAFSRVADLWRFLDETERAYPGLPVVLPSGLGVPVTRAGDLLDADLAEMTLLPSAPATDGLAAFLAEARRRLRRAFCIPGVKLLSSVPRHRKLHRVDLGTAAVLCAAAWALHCQATAGRPAAACSFLHLHLNSDGRTLLAIVQGRVVDGLGASTLGFGAPPLDIWDDLAKRTGEFRGHGRPGNPEAHAAAVRSAAQEALRKESHALLATHRLTEVVITGAGRQHASQWLEHEVEHTSLPAPVDGYEAALGAAVIAAGLTGGPTAGLVDRLGLRETRERVLDGLRP
jgi:hypothetical protein